MRLSRFLHYVNIFVNFFLNDLFIFFFDFVDFFLKLPRLLLKVAKVTAGHQNWQKIVQRAKKALGWSPLQEPEQVCFCIFYYSSMHCVIIHCKHCDMELFEIALPFMINRGDFYFLIINKDGGVNTCNRSLLQTVASMFWTKYVHYT